jgi:hypothetical protein
LNIILSGKEESPMKFSIPALVLFVFAGTLCSCIGLKTDIVLKADGTGTVTMEYRISREFQDIGALDGNARWPTVPVGQADFERTISRTEGLRLLSFSTGEEGPNLLYRATVGFSKLEDILPLLGEDGKNISLIREERRSLVLRLTPGREAESEGESPELLALVEEAFRGYDIAISFSAPSPVELRVREGKGLEIEQGGRKAGFSIPISEIVSRREALTVEFIF